jgi:hypothetical protein
MAVAFEEFDIDLWRWRYGLPAPIWITRAPEIGKFLERRGVEPVAEEQLFGFTSLGTTFAGAPQVEKAGTFSLPRPRPFPGGLRFPHLHFEGRVYRLNREQWSEFSRAVVADLGARLQETQVVGFRELLDADATVGALG